MSTSSVSGSVKGPCATALARSTRVLSWMAATVLLLMMIHVCVDVAARILKLPLVGTNEIVAAYYMVAIVFLPMAYVALIGANITVDLFTNHLDGRAQLVTGLIAAALGFVVSATWLWQAAGVALHSMKITERWVIGSTFLQVWPGKWLLVLSVGLLCLAFLGRMLTDARALLSGPISELQAHGDA